MKIAILLLTIVACGCDMDGQLQSKCIDGVVWTKFPGDKFWIIGNDRVVCKEDL